MATGRKKTGNAGGAGSVELVLLRRRIINGRQFEAGDVLGTVELADGVTPDKLELCCHARQAIVRENAKAPATPKTAAKGGSNATLSSDFSAQGD